MEEKEVLTGGRVGKIIKEGNCVVRPSNVWTKEVHKFLNYLLEHGFTEIPVPYGINEAGKEVVSFAEGVVYNDELPDFILRDEILEAVAKRMVHYHEIGAAYVDKLSGNEAWMLKTQYPIEVMCHGDIAPYNTTFVGTELGGMIDFDTLHPGPRLWDIAYAVYRWVPFVSPENPDYHDGAEEQIRKLKVFADAYGLGEQERKKLPEMMIARVESLMEFMREQATAGNEDMARNIAEGHLDLYINDVAYMRTHMEAMAEGMCK